jgi:hypothetical protein
MHHNSQLLDVQPWEYMDLFESHQSFLYEFKFKTVDT